MYLYWVEECGVGVDAIIRGSMGGRADETMVDGGRAASEKAGSSFRPVRTGNVNTW